MASNLTSNRAYLRKIAKEIQSIPREIALSAGKKIFLAMVTRTHVDTGQAALNWNFLPYASKPEAGEQKVLWGSAPGYQNAVYPVLPKFSDTVQDLPTLIDYMNGKANYIVNGAPARINGVLIYNPIAPGFAEFAPGDDTYYEENALYTAEGAADSVTAECVLAAENEVAAKHGLT